MLKVEMWLDKYYFLNVLTFLIKCNVIDNNDSQKGLYGNIYLAKNVEHSEINKKLSEIMHAINSTRKHGTNGQKTELAGSIIILKKVGNHELRAHSKDKTADTSNVNNDISKKSKEQKNARFFREPYRKIIVVIPDGTNKRVSLSREGLRIDDSKDSKLERKNKEIVHSKSNILRDKYVDACMKVAVRKCYKALAAVNKYICKVRYKCESSFKSYFKEKSKEGCIEEFDYTNRSNSTNNKRKLKKKRASGKRDKNFIDATRQGYLDACIPYMVPKYKPKKIRIKIKGAHKSLRNNTLATTFAEVLRGSRSERKCRRLSRMKCVKACHFAAKESCAKYDCSRKWMKAVGSECKGECKRAYRVELSTSDSSDTSGSY